MKTRILKFKATTKQRLALKYLYDNKTESVGYGGGGGGGKSFCGCFWVWSMCQRYPGVRYFFAREELKRLKQTTLVSYFEFLEKYEIPEQQQGKFSNINSSISFENGSEILLLELSYKPSDPLGRRFGSFLFTGGFIDESYECNFDYIDVLYSRIGRWKNAEYSITPKILETFNPDKGHVYTRFYQPYKNGNMPTDRKFVPALVIDTLKHPSFFKKNYSLHPDDIGTEAGIYVETLQNRSQIVRERLLWGNFEYDNDPNKLIQYDAILDLFTNEFVKSTKNKCIVADIAMYGSDFFVIGVWYGNVLVECYHAEKSGGEEIIGKLKEIALSHSIPESKIIYDGDGLGSFIGGPGGFLKNAKPFINNSRPDFVKKEGGKEGKEYANLKSFCAYKLAEEINNNKLFLKALQYDEGVKERLIKELEQLKGKHLGDDLKKKDIISKEEMKKNLNGKSPDFLDMLIMKQYLNHYKPISRPKKRRVRFIG